MFPTGQTPLTANRQRIWRMETAAGIGPFEYGRDLEDPEGEAYYQNFPKAVGWTKPVMKEFGFFGMRKSWDIPKDHPHHLDDLGEFGGTDYHWKVGTRDEDQFHHWFPVASLVYLASLGFELVIYECSPMYIHYGQYQLLFCVEDATLIERRPLV